MAGEGVCLEGSERGEGVVVGGEFVEGRCRRIVVVGREVGHVGVLLRL